MVIVFGSINLDLVTHVAALPGPGETVLGREAIAVPGGKGANQALAARRAGADVVMVGAVGRDSFADMALTRLEADGVDISRVARADSPTGLAFITVDSNGANQIVVASGANQLVSASALDDLDVTEGDILLLQGEVDHDETAAAARWGAERGLIVILNRAPAGSIAPELLGSLDVVIVNETEARAVAGALELEITEPEDLAETLDARFSITCIVSLGSAGAVGWSGGVRSQVPALPVDVVDTTAAGDAFCGAYAAALDRGMHFVRAMEHGCAAGSLACETMGAQTSLPDRDAIEDGALVLARRDMPLAPP
ncbi:MAG: ribokinase [Alphaproteobacteria bacterium]